MRARYDQLVFEPAIPATMLGRGAVKITGASASRLILQSEARSTSRTHRATLLVVLPGDERHEFDVDVETTNHEESSPYHLLAMPRAEFGSEFQRLLARLRKGQHITLCRDEDVEASDRDAGFAEWKFRPKTLPEMDWDDIATRRSFLGRTFDWPIMIPGMTGGLTQGAEINHRLARAAAAFNIPMGVGSQRVALDHPEYGRVFEIKREVPGVFLIGNIGIAQLTGPDALDKCRRAVEMIEADALAIHANVLQEVLQVEGDHVFRGLKDTILTIASKLGRPVILKEVGVGVDPETASELLSGGLAAIDIGGKGGTSWGYIESLRSSSSLVKSIGRTFRDFGIPTAHALRELRTQCPSAPLIATGGIRDGLDIAKAVALGATMAGVGLPLFRAALESQESVERLLMTLGEGLKTTMICVGARELDQLATRLYRA
jgi:isopentenyl-diphosphate delta-isomerase